MRRRDDGARKTLEEKGAAKLKRAGTGMQTNDGPKEGADDGKMGVGKLEAEVENAWG